MHGMGGNATISLGFSDPNTVHPFARVGCPAVERLAFAFGKARHR
jgi:hypothetical protein